MININRVSLGGNLTKKPEISVTKGGTSACKFTLAHNDIKGDIKSAYFFNIVCYGKLAENCGKYLDKGSAVLVEGKITNRSYKTEDGTSRTITEIYPSNVHFLSSSKGKPASEQPQQGDIEY